MRAGRTSTAALWTGEGGIVLTEVPRPRPEPGEVLVEVLLATVCGSDLHTFRGRRPGPCPSVLGHETVGEIVEIGTGGALTVDKAAVQIGDRLIWGVTVACHTCDRCRSGRTAKCRSLRKAGHEAFDSPWPLSGGYAEHVLLPAGATLAGVPSGLADAVAAPAACSTATAMAVLEAAGPLAGRRVLITGAGMLGLTACAASRHRGASSITVIDVDAQRLEVARRFGADQVALAGRRTPIVDIALELSGSSEAASSALESLDVGGVLVLAGSASPGAPLQVPPERVVRGWWSIHGVHNYEPRHLREAVSFLSETTDRWPWADLVSTPVALDQLESLLLAQDRPRPRDAVRPRSVTSDGARSPGHSS